MRRSWDQLDALHDPDAYYPASMARDAIALCHKIALCDIPSGTLVVKYGESIGEAIRDIRRGEHVHTGNLRSLRGRSTAGGG